MRSESVSDHGNFVRARIEEPAVKVIDLRRVHGQEGEAGVEFLPGVYACLAQLLPQQRVGPLAIPGHLGDDARNLRGLGIKNRSHQPSGVCRLPLLCDLFSDRQAGDRRRRPSSRPRAIPRTT